MPQGYPGRRALEGDAGVVAREAAKMRGIGSAMPGMAAPRPNQAGGVPGPVPYPQPAGPVAGSRMLQGMSPEGLQLLRLLNRSMKRRPNANA